MCLQTYIEYLKNASKSLSSSTVTNLPTLYSVKINEEKIKDVLSKEKDVIPEYIQTELCDFLYILITLSSKS